MKLGLPGAAKTGTVAAASWLGLGGLKWIGLAGGLAAAGIAVTVAARARQPEAGAEPKAVEQVARVEPGEEPARELPEADAPPIPADASVPTESPPSTWEGIETAVVVSEPAPAPALRRAEPESSPAVMPGGRPGSRAALQAEVARVQAIRDAVRAGTPIDAAIGEYRAAHPTGVLRPEVDALAVEHGCRQATDSTARASARKKVDEFARRWPGSALVDRLTIVCEKK